MPQEPDLYLSDRQRERITDAITYAMRERLRRRKFDAISRPEKVLLEMEVRSVAVEVLKDVNLGIVI